MILCKPTARREIRTRRRHVVGTDSIAMGRMRSSEQVVATALRALERGRSVVIDGTLNTLVAVVAKRLSFALGARLAAGVTRPQTPAETTIPGRAQ
jgi:uncharacterized protein